MNIISASRRTDIPAFYMPWFVGRLREGVAAYPNPRTGQLYPVSLKPEDVHSIVFWSKNYGPFLNHLDEVVERGYRFYCHYTITGAPEFLEPHIPCWERSVEVFRTLVERTSPRHVIWRYDPILFTDNVGAEHYFRRFQRMAEELTGATQRCYFSFAFFYGKTERQLRKGGIRFIDPSLDEKRALVGAMAEIAEGCGFTLYACCQDSLVTGKVQKGHCVDGDLLTELFADRPRVSKMNPTRKECGCFISRDVGVYDTCPHGCLYCYANHNRKKALKLFRAHNPEGMVLAE